tara:strand:- start:1279 stop:2457 length:1179 start_codon:yes stop_codon:yes gene_type:complete
MVIPINGLVDNDLVAHTKYTISNNELLTYYVDKSIGLESLDRYEANKFGEITYVDTIKTINVGHDPGEHDFIRETFNKLDKIIDLDFIEMPHNNGSMLDIYHISYSSHFKENVIGQALSQRTQHGGWWDVFWKDSPLTGEINKNSDYNTIIHEIGHTLGLSHPFNDPSNKSWNSKDTIMSYIPSDEGWDKWFSQSDLNALISIWGRENDDGIVKHERNSSDYKYKKSSKGNLYIETEIGYEDITEIKTLIFRDKSLSVQEDIFDVFDLIIDIDDISGKIYRLYNASFGRFPDKQGLKYWIEKNISGEDTYRETAKSFILSNEFIELYGNSATNENYISSLYENILGRVPDNDGFNYWLAQIEKGYEDKSELLMGFAESIENKSIFSAETSLI